MKTLIATPTAESPFDSPSVRDKTPEFMKQFDVLVREQIVPAFARYRDFLQKEYLPAAREAIAVSANPNGAACYDASVRFHSSLPMAAKDVHALGLREIERLDAEMKAIGQRSFNTPTCRSSCSGADRPEISCSRARRTSSRTRRRRSRGRRRRRRSGLACCRKRTS